MGSNWVIIDKKSKEYCWLGKTLDKNRLERFLYEHQVGRLPRREYEGLLFGCYQDTMDLMEYCFGDSYAEPGDLDYTEVSYSVET